MHFANPRLALSVAIAIGVRALRCRLLVLLACAPLGAFTYETFAAANFSPPDLGHPAGFMRRIAGLLKPNCSS